MHETLSRLNFDGDAEFLTEQLARVHGWTIHSKAYPVIDVTFHGSRSLRVRLTCDDWPEKPPSAELMDANGNPPLGLPGGVFHQDLHPETKKPFVCMRGFREYHTHSSHLTDHWETYKGQDGMNLPGLLAQLSHAWKKATQ